MSKISTGALRSARTAASPPKPAPTTTTRGVCRSRPRSATTLVILRRGLPETVFGPDLYTGSITEDAFSATAPTIDGLEAALAAHRYIAGRSLATTVYLALQLQKPLLLEGEAGVGKTEVGKVLAEILGTRLIRLQCYEGIDVNQAVYEWNYSRQMLHIRMLEAAHFGGRPQDQALEEIFGPTFLIKRPLLQALEPDGVGPPVLLIDEIDRSDDEFEAFLLELLSDYQITIPEMGTLRAERPPVVVITSNRTREIHDALKRRCLYYWIDYPSPETERRIIEARVPGAPARLAAQIVALVQLLRRQDLYKLPGVAETLDWTRALVALGQEELTADVVAQTLGAVVKYQEDLQKLRQEALPALVHRARESAR